MERINEGNKKEAAVEAASFLMIEFLNSYLLI